MIELTPEEDRAFLMGAPIGRIPASEVEEHLAELVRLADTAGAKVVGIMVQRLDAPQAHLYIGKGKAQLLGETAREKDANLIIFDEELKPDQAKNLEDFLGIRVMDRSELILDIFATRARTREARLQVELAQLEYLLPRLKRMWSHLSRIRGGIGLRGPGETQLETDRRLVGTRIADLKRKLEGVARTRATQRDRRTGQYRVALVGYTNAGKSSLLRTLSGSNLFVEDRLFATLDSATRTVEVGDGHPVLVTDTVGFIRKLPHHLVASFRSTLEEAREADLLLHVIDGSHLGWEEQYRVVQEVLEELDLHERPQLRVFNKMDLLTHGEESALRERLAVRNDGRDFFLSAREGDGIQELKDALASRVHARLARVDLRLPPEDGETLATIYREGEVLRRWEEEGDIRVEARITPALLGRLQKMDGVVMEAGKWNGSSS